jgi:nucleoid DNA-binding protein
MSDRIGKTELINRVIRQTCRDKATVTEIIDAILEEV